jgi:hypothetical protein
MNRKVLIRIVILIVGLGITSTSLFAYQLGLDNNPNWGAGRLRILFFGLAVILFGGAYWLMPVLLRLPLVQKLTIMFGGVQKVNDLSSSARKKETGQLFRYVTDIILILMGIGVVWIYVWIITIGRFDKWPSGSNYYWLLTQAFRQGQTHLLIEPSPKLLGLENPYDFQQRKGLEYLWDASLYNGKYYLYWGPIPSVVGMAISSITLQPATDAGLVFIFVVGATIFSVLLLRAIYREYKYPGWLFFGTVLVIALNVPMIWLLARPKYYEVSVAGGQFFIMMGFYLLFLAFRSSMPHKGFLFLSALAFGLAGGSRINLIPSVIFLALIIMWRIYDVHGRHLTVSIPSLAAVIIPLTVIAGALAWYNYDRFGSIFEFGHRYQLTSPALTVAFNKPVSVDYVIPNLYNYAFRMPTFSDKFPFLTVYWIKESTWPSFIRIPEGYYSTDQVAGILIVVPLVGLVVLLGLRTLWLKLNGDVDLHFADPVGWFAFSLSGYCLIQVVVLLVFITSAMRYLADITPVALVLVAIFAGSLTETFAPTPLQRRAVGVLWILVSISTSVMGVLIGITGGRNNFLNQNPQLYYQLLKWFSH